ncbi:MAG: prolyl aminopeptidase [Albidovulum sp.]|nr:prolyl aminopeptidase [Albidovulum sp.]MDE0307672.1 prolyl aminopeptidase [Albidovulum sp.]MDE0532153.1 prolyl aminopeptidase [Albidovulum sp.]
MENSTSALNVNSPERKFRAGVEPYRDCEPFDLRIIEVGDGHSLYLEQCGSPIGAPVLVLHGGPGGGCNSAMRYFFDPAAYRAILFDQRGCGRSRPNASVAANTTQHLLGDIEKIRNELGIDRWILFGGSWGASLALLYAQMHPERVAGMVLRGVFLMSSSELCWFYRGGAAKFWPSEWEQFVEPIPEKERGDLIKAYHRRLFCGDVIEEIAFAKRWFRWESALATLDDIGGRDVPSTYARAFARLECHYFSNDGFLDYDGQILDGASLLGDIPGVIIQGRYDMICPPAGAFELSRRWRGSKLKIVPAAGHALSEKNIQNELLQVMDEMKNDLQSMGL